MFVLLKLFDCGPWQYRLMSNDHAGQNSRSFL